MTSVQTGTLHGHRQAEDALELVPCRVQAGLRLAARFSEPDGASVVAGPGPRTLSQWVSDRAALIDLLQGHATPRTATPDQLLFMWAEAIGQTRPELPAAERYLIARQCRAADRLLGQWQTETSRPPTPQTQSGFMAWRAAVHSELQRQGMSTPEAWVSRLAERVRAGSVPGGVLSPGLRLAGFPEFTRVENELFDALAVAGHRVEWEPPPAVSGARTERRAFDSAAEEWSAAAQWAARRVASGARRLAIVVNGLQSVASPVRRALEDELQGLDIGCLNDAAESLVCMPSGLLPVSFPVVDDALLLLRLAAGAWRNERFEFPLISRLLLSRVWAGGDDERFARARLEMDLRGTGYMRWSLSALADFARRREGGATAVPELLHAIAGLSGPVDGMRPARQLLRWLQQWGWPGARPRVGPARTAINHLLELLESLAGCDVPDWRACLFALERRCMEPGMADSGGPFSPVQVLTPEQAYGMTFDAAWVMNLSLASWPPRPVSNPFLPASVLTSVPRGTEGGVLDYAERMTAALSGCAEEVVFSWCRRLEDLSVSASPLIRHLPVQAPAAVARSAVWRALAPACAVIRGLDEHPFLAARGPEQGVPLEAVTPRLEHAVELLGLQSACPLAAYLAFRLGARTTPVPGPGQAARWRGTLVHAALERLYRDPVERGTWPTAAAIPQAVDAALKECRARRHLSPAEIAALQASLEALLGAWLEFDRLGPGAEIKALEGRHSIRFKGLDFEVRIDRLEQLPGGGLCLVDYKTGAAGAAPRWADERLGDIQLPLYAALLSEQGDLEPAALAIATVRPGHLKWTGLTSDPQEVRSGLAHPGQGRTRLARRFGDWSEALAFWREQVAVLIDEFVQGDCRHQVFREDELRYHDLELLLRTGEARRWLSANP